MTSKADELLKRMQRETQPPMAPDEPVEYIPPEEVIENVMRRYGFTREVAIQELRKTGHY